MIPRTAAVLVLFFLTPALAEAQDPPPSEPGRSDTVRTHVVQEGETLASIARTYLNEPDAWRRIFEANRDTLSDPHRIFPGMRLVIPGSGTPVPTTEDPSVSGVEVIRGRPDEPARVTGVEVEEDRPAGDTLSLPEVGGPEVERRRLLRSRSFVPAAIPTHEGARTVFYGNLRRTADGPVRPGVYVTEEGESLAVSPSAFQGAAWLVASERDPDEIGAIESFSGDREVREERTTLQPFDQVRVRLESPGELGPGDHLVAYHEVGRLPDRGDVMAPSGLLEIESLEGAGAVAQVLHVYDRLELGHRVMLPRPFSLSPGEYPSATEEELAGTVLGFRDRKEVYVPGDQAFVDLGARDGLAVGDELAGVVGEGEGWAGRRVARFRVISVREDHATLQLISSEAPSAVRAGLPVVVDRKMP